MGARFLVTWSRGVAPKTRGPGNASNPATPPECRTYQSGNKCDTLAGSYTFPGVLFPGVIGTSCLDTQLNSDDPSGASPLRDRQAVAVGLGSFDRIAHRQRLSLLYLKAQMRHPCATSKKDGTTLTRSPNLKNLFNEINASDKQNLYLTSPTGGLYYTLLLVT